MGQIRTPRELTIVIYFAICYFAWNFDMSYHFTFKKLYFDLHCSNLHLHQHHYFNWSLQNIWHQRNRYLQHVPPSISNLALLQLRPPTMLALPRKHAQGQRKQNHRRLYPTYRHHCATNDQSWCHQHLLVDL